jgi:hypothetical protein
MTYAETLFLFVSVIGFSGVWYLLFSIRQELEAIRHLLVFSADHPKDNNDR